VNDEARDPERLRLRTPATVARMCQRAVAANPTLRARAMKIQAHLVGSEEMLLRTVSDDVTHGFVEAAPMPFADPDFGHVPFWLNYPDDDQMQAVADLWRSVYGQLPPTRFTPETYGALVQTLRDVQFVGPDGSIFGDRKYELLDPGGVPMVGEYLWHYLLEDFAPFCTTPPIIRLEGSASDCVSIAIVGDWGTGAYPPAGPAADVMRHVVALAPDYVVHLGDVYYSGTADEERRHLLAGWGGAAGRSFTLNSNHEMYDGGHGYFEIALADPVFGAQNRCSYCALQFGTAPNGASWTILLLDSAYWSTSPLVSAGSLGNPDSSRPGAMAQLAFISSLDVPPEYVIVVTHHNPIAFDGSSIVDDGAGNNMWAQIAMTLGEPAAWYWGHIHNAIVYTSPIGGSACTKGRCIGHAAIPFGRASGLAGWAHPPAPQSKRVEWFAHTPNPDPATAPRVYNGFAYLTLGADGCVTEVFYDQTGQAVYRPAPYRLGVGH
jgi:hypothetical protein